VPSCIAAWGYPFLQFKFCKMTPNFSVLVAESRHIPYAAVICEEMAASAQARGTGIARRTPAYIAEKIQEGKAVIAFSPEGEWAGFCYIETWGHGAYVANSGLIVSPRFRKSGLAKQIKSKIFDLSRTLCPDAKIFGLTTGLAVMKINSDLGYEPVTYSELTQDDEFWKGCTSCVNYQILMSKERKNCLCTAMLYDPSQQNNVQATAKIFKEKSKVFERLLRIKRAGFLKYLPKIVNRIKSIVVL
jgi:hypothetical protein